MRGPQLGQRQGTAAENHLTTGPGYTLVVGDVAESAKRLEYGACVEPRPVDWNA